MKGLTIIKGKKDIIAMIFRKNIPIDGVKFFTGENNPFQIGIHERPQGVILTPHVHKMEKKIVISAIQEVLSVKSGKVKITLYEADGTRIKDVVLDAGDDILLMSGGHGLEVLEDTRIFEIKQGPFPGVTHAKIYLENNLSKKSKSQL